MLPIQLPSRRCAAGGSQDARQTLHTPSASPHPHPAPARHSGLPGDWLQQRFGVRQEHLRVQAEAEGEERTSAELAACCRFLPHRPTPIPAPPLLRSLCQPRRHQSFQPLM